MCSLFAVYLLNVYEKYVYVCTCLCFDIREGKKDFNRVGFAMLIRSVSKRVSDGFVVVFWYWWCRCRVAVAWGCLGLSLLSSCLSRVGNDIWKVLIMIDSILSLRTLGY